jgi:hypothetical protein
MYQDEMRSVPPFPPLVTSQDGFLPDPFPYLGYILALAGTTTRIMLAKDPGSFQKEQLHTLQLALNEFNLTLPDELRFETPKFRAYVPLLQGGAFVLIHVGLNSRLQYDRTSSLNTHHLSALLAQLWFHTSVLYARRSDRVG